MMKDDPMVRTRSITVELLDDVKMLELEVEGNFYRAEKLPYTMTKRTCH